MIAEVKNYMSRVRLAGPVWQVFGANTDVGKTVIACLLVTALASRVAYIKPVSTGPAQEADTLHVQRYAGVSGSVLFQFARPCSPHIAAAPNPPADSLILKRLSQQLEKHAGAGPVVVETAGGVHSPSPAGTSQLDLYRPLRLPVLLVADSKLGGISTTISAHESLTLRGYDVVAIIGFHSDWGNMEYLSDKYGDVVHQLHPPPERSAADAKDALQMKDYYETESRSLEMISLVQSLDQWHRKRILRLEEMAGKALDTLWYPFTQHALLNEKSVTTIDSAHGDHFQSFDSVTRELGPLFDASASWWTQGLGHGNAKLGLEAAYAAGRYGHVILPNAVNEPALSLAQKLLAGVGKDWASRVYYSDNGATGIEVALKMALKSARVRYGADQSYAGKLKLGIIGFKGSYHGDTIGAMDASDPNVYNAEVDWYAPRGHFFDPPTLIYNKGKYQLTIPHISGTKDKTVTPAIKPTQLEFDLLSEIFDLEKRRETEIAGIYRAWITADLEDALTRGQRFGAVLFEPILMGAGGMIFVDPLFQHILTTTVRASDLFCPPSSKETDWKGLPVITDEVFTGLYRLGVERSSTLLGIEPDISVYAKLLTGGLVPLAVTLSTESIFQTFYQSEKKDALLHGHSYTAHPIGTSVALASLKTYEDLRASDHYDEMNRDWHGEPMASVWSRSFAESLSHHPGVQGLVVLGSVLAITLKTQKGGYESKAATRVLERLREGDPENGGVLARPLGNVIYFMASQITCAATARVVEAQISHALDQYIT